jgi:hypothetical protein
LQAPTKYELVINLTLKGSVSLRVELPAKDGSRFWQSRLLGCIRIPCLRRQL